MVGALLGWHGVVVALFGGSVIGSVIGIIRLAGSSVPRKRPNEPAGDAPDARAVADATELPFGPYLATAAVFYLFAAPWIDLHFRL